MQDILAIRYIATVHTTLPVLGAGELAPLLLLKSSISGGIIVEHPSVAAVE